MQQVEWVGECLSVRSASSCLVMTRDSCPTLEGGSSSVNVYLWFSQWLENVVTIRSKFCLGSWNSKSFFSLGRDEGWVRVTSTAALPKLLPLHTSATPHKVSLLPNCTFYLSVSYLSSKNFSEISCSVFEGAFLFSNVLIIAHRFMEEKFYWVEKQNLSKTLVRLSCFMRFRWDCYSHFWFSLLWEKF